MAQKLGLPIKHFIASTNINDTVPNYLVMEFTNQNHLKQPFLMPWMLEIQVILSEYKNCLTMI